MESRPYRGRMHPALRGLALLSSLTLLPSCTTVGSMMSPYSEKFSCKNEDHGQCIHPDEAYADAVAGRASHSDPRVTNDRKLLRDGDGEKASAPSGTDAAHHKADAPPATAFVGYRDSVYRELQGLIDAPVTPMLRSPRTVRTLILPYADRQRPDRLYMPRYVYSILEAPSWVVGDYLVNPVSPAATAPVLGQVQDKPTEYTPAADNAEPQP
ncbi:TraV family lipoprotein [Sphingomonas sp. BIUV-7]|uniref:TraV family lipoprotein n=1 Tax=Sphingomonas natans TaxID=3063330 RepID=A0ABT8YCM5_9SPHN|nr:TraV family lipoprotein [Sphingomonas sp. BIUV-7]MDO6415439.1 TraV family lipoprotein [Sphingomonas sp. BIUV-7]